MYHNRLLFGAVRSDVLHVEVEGELEVELDSTHLPFTADSVLHFQVYLRTVECTVTLIELIAVGTVLLFEDSLQVSLSLVPYLYITHEVVRTCGELSLVLQTEGVVHLCSDVHDVVYLGGYLLLSNEDVSIVLSELLNTEQAVELAGLLLAVDNVYLVEFKGQLLVGTLSVHVYLYSVRAVHRLSAVYLVVILSRDNEHTVLVVVPVTGSHPELLL